MVDYLKSYITDDRNNWKDSNCATDPTKRCEFHTMSGCLMQRVVHSSGVLRLNVTNQFGSDEKSLKIGNGPLPKPGVTLEKPMFPGDTTTSLGAVGIDSSTTSGTQVRNNWARGALGLPAATYI